MAKRYNHAVTVAFTVMSDKPDMPTQEELFTGMYRRMYMLHNKEDEIGGEEFEVFDTSEDLDLGIDWEQWEKLTPHIFQYLTTLRELITFSNQYNAKQ